jgi:Protein kinase domain
MINEIKPSSSINELKNVASIAMQYQQRQAPQPAGKLPLPPRPSVTKPEIKSHLGVTMDAAPIPPKFVPPKPLAPKPMIEVPPKPEPPAKPTFNNTDTRDTIIEPPKPETLTRRPKARGPSIEEVTEQLRKMCNPLDPTKLYRNLVKIGQGASGGVYTARKSDSNQPVAIKQMNLEEQPKKELIINEILVMASAKHRNIVNFIDSFLHDGDLWVHPSHLGCDGVHGRRLFN